MSKPAVDRATPQITEPTGTAEEMVQTGTTTITAIKNSPGWATSPEVQAAVASWLTANTNLDVNNQAKGAARSSLTLAETNEPPLMRRWLVRKNAVLVAINAAGDGSAQTVQNFAMTVEQKHAAPMAVVPTNVRPMKKKVPSYASIRWDVTPGAHGYLLQHATNPSDATTYSAQIATSHSRYDLTGQTPGTTIYFRVLACDARLPNGQTAWSAWVPVVVTG